MSGVEAIAVVGAVASVITLLDACNKLSARLKNGNQIPSLISLAPRLELVAVTISPLKSDTVEEHQNDKLQLCLGEVQSVLVQLEKCLSVLETSARDNVFKVLSTRKKSYAAFQHFKKLEADLDRWQHTLCLYVVTRMSMLTANPSPKPKEHPPSSPGMLFNQVAIATKRQQKSACQRGICRCLCHMSRRQQRALIICTPAHALFRCSCQTKEISVSISALQRILSIQMRADWTQGLRLNCSLRFRNTVKRTSPGSLPSRNVTTGD
jgi:hypothetical protein